MLLLHPSGCEGRKYPHRPTVLKKAFRNQLTTFRT